MGFTSNFNWKQSKNIPIITLSGFVKTTLSILPEQFKNFSKVKLPNFQTMKHIFVLILNHPTKILKLFDNHFDKLLLSKTFQVLENGIIQFYSFLKPVQTLRYAALVALTDSRIISGGLD